MHFFCNKIDFKEAAFSHFLSLRWHEDYLILTQ